MMAAVLASRPKKAFLPAFRALASAGFMVNAPLLALVLLRGWTWAGASLFSGYALGLLIYGFLYGMVNASFTVSAKTSGTKKPLPASFGLIMIGKMALFGGAVALLLCVFHVAALWMLGGLFLTQIGVTANVMRWLRDSQGTF